jgi:hypothetical protein
MPKVTSGTMTTVNVPEYNIAPGAPPWVHNAMMVEECIRLLSEGQSDPAIATSLGLSLLSFTSGLSCHPALRRARVAYMESQRLSIAQKAIGFGPRALTVLMDIAEDVEAKDTARVNAAKQVLFHAGVASKYQYDTEAALRENKPVSPEEAGIAEIFDRLRMMTEGVKRDGLKKDPPRVDVTPVAPTSLIDTIDTTATTPPSRLNESDHVDTTVPDWLRPDE